MICTREMFPVLADPQFEKRARAGALLLSHGFYDLVLFYEDDWWELDGYGWGSGPIFLIVCKTLPEVLERAVKVYGFPLHQYQSTAWEPYYE